MPSYTRFFETASSHNTRVAQRLFPTPHHQPTMVCYELNFTISSPGKSITLIEFSPNGRFLAVGDRGLSSLYILDRLTGFHPTISATTPAEPTALVWETPKTFYVGLGDGRIIHYRIDLAGKKLVKGAVNGLFYGASPTTAIALDAESKTLVLSVGSDVFVLRRIRTTGRFIYRRFGAVNSCCFRRILLCRQYLKPLLFQK
jgi:WD40 repeat protein